VNKNTHATVPYRIIFLTGVDGSGKTCFARKLVDILNSQGISSIHVWSRFNNYFSKPLLAFTRIVGLNYYEVRNGVRTGYHDFEKSEIVSRIFILLQLLDVWIASIIRFWIPIIKSRKIIVSDRGPYDTLIDVALDTGKKNLPNTLMGRLYLKSIPFSHKVFFLSRDRHKIEQSRPDIKNDRKFQRRLELYLANEKVLNFQRISNNASIDEAIEQIIDELFHEKEEAS